MEITYNKGIRPSNQTQIQSMLVPHLWLVPGWVQSIHCNLWDGQEQGERISVTVNYDYRSVTLDFAAGWLDESDEMQSKQVLHELVHIHLCLVANYARDKINVLCPTSEAEKFNAVLQEELRMRHESATCDLTDVIWNKITK